ncbi:hypothetical protein [Streptomyces sp. NPDC007346]|uniref:hypothetical protein n=1 Tax=Streptomyces sp. NPDC007346 TaxID=3154682 RepID=UPI0034513954
MNLLSRVAATAAALPLLAGATLASAAPANAAPSGIADCPYPYVCLYDSQTKRKVGQFKDITSGYQAITNRTYHVKNTRYDDVAYFRHFSSYVCIAPRAVTDLPAVNGIRISSEAKCR